jgi:hypothetical protein
MDQVNHFSHEHPLIFAEELEHEDKKEVICSDEEPIISGPGQATNAPDRAIFFSINPASSSPARYMQHRLHPNRTTPLFSRCQIRKSNIIVMLVVKIARSRTMGAISTSTSNVLLAGKSILTTVTNTHLSPSRSRSSSLAKSVVRKARPILPTYVPYVDSWFTTDVLNFNASSILLRINTNSLSPILFLIKTHYIHRTGYSVDSASKR